MQLVLLAFRDIQLVFFVPQFEVVIIVCLLAGLKITIIAFVGAASHHYLAPGMIAFAVAFVAQFPSHVLTSSPLDW
jgi:hypothetical protein